MHIHTRTRTHTSLPYMGTCVPTGKAVQWPLVGCGADFEHVDHECIHTHEPAPAAGQSSERSRVNVEMATFSRPPSTCTRPQNPMISQLESSIQRRMRYVSWGRQHARGDGFMRRRPHDLRTNSSKTRAKYCPNFGQYSRNPRSQSPVNLRNPARK